MKDKDFIFGKHTPQIMPFEWHQVNDLVILTFMQREEFSDYVAAKGIVFHKHIFLFKLSMMDGL